MDYLLCLLHLLVCLGTFELQQMKEAWIDMTLRVELAWTLYYQAWVTIQYIQKPG